MRFGSREADWRNSFNGLPAGVKLANYPTQVMNAGDAFAVCGTQQVLSNVPPREARRHPTLGWRGKGLEGQLLLMKINVNV